MLWYFIRKKFFFFDFFFLDKEADFCDTNGSWTLGALKCKESCTNLADGKIECCDGEKCSNLGIGVS